MSDQFEFSSHPCTTREQSERLLSLGLKKETADCGHFYVPEEHLEYYYWETCILEDGWKPYWEVTDNEIPAWSFHRLIEMMPESIHLDSFADTHYYRTLLPSKIIYMKYDHTWIWQSDKQNDFDKCVDTIEWLIKEGYLNKEYLEE